MELAYRTSATYAVCLLLWLLPSASSQAQAADVMLHISDGAAINAQLGDGESLSIPRGSYAVSALSSVPVARMRLQAAGSSDCDVGQLLDISTDDDPSTSADDSIVDRFSSGLFFVSEHNATTCSVIVHTWYENFRYAGRAQVNLTFTVSPVNPETPPKLRPQPRTHEYTTTADSTLLDVASPPLEHGLQNTSLYCESSYLKNDESGGTSRC